jgi:hypothetical protein
VKEEGGCRIKSGMTTFGIKSAMTASCLARRPLVRHDGLWDQVRHDGLLSGMTLASFTFHFFSLA